MTVKVGHWSAVEFLETEQDMKAYLDEAAATGDPALIKAAQCDVAKARSTDRPVRLNCPPTVADLT
ncbi:MAG: hypothetical protein Q4G35_00135 [Propionibacteriaceae bacterium]|nr:hypothetical protein [Propionibacteriaceae bacterium]